VADRTRACIVVDARIARRRATGAAVHVNGLRRAIARIDPQDLDVRFLDGPPGLPRRNRLTTLGNLALDLAWTHVIVPVRARLLGAAAIHAPFNWAPWWSRVPTVVTVHDLAWERVPETFPAFFRRYARLFTRRSVRRARLVITDSDATGRDLTELYGVPSAKLRTIPIGVEPDRAPPRTREPFVLAVGELEPRKRIAELVDGHRRYFAEAPAHPPPCRLVIVGTGGADEGRVRAMAGPECDMLGRVDDATLTGLYRTATLLAYPSAYEGFGLPVLEAMAHGCPVLVARNSSLPEVGGDAAIYLDDPTPEGIAGALTGILADRGALADRGQRSVAHAGRFGWDRVARETLDVYRELTG
jgi:glycosyltransferase involved in cell wall biosynthesis